jgi:hypothetical protein
MILRCLLLALLCVITYVPTLSIPLLEDDYPNIGLAQTFGSFSDLPRLFDDAVLRPRATTWWSMLLLWRNFNVNPVPYHVFALILHIGNTLMLYGLAMLWQPMRSAAFPAAAFFAVHEGHQEAVMWLSGMTEVFLFFFGIAAVLCWMQAEHNRHGWLWRAAALILFAFTLVSKESGVILLPFFVLTAPLPPSRSSILRLLPLFALAAVAVIATFATQSYSFRFTTFSLHAPFWITWPRSFARLLWVWGWLALGVIFWQKRDRDLKKSALLTLVWIGIAFAPYSFLAHPYSTQIASRQTYLASAGLALLFGLAFAFVSRNTNRPRLVVPAILSVMLIYNVGWIWTKKRAQFLERAAPTEELIALARRSNGPIWMRCFPRQEVIADEAVRLGAGRPANTLVWTEAEATRRGATAVFCHPDR